MGKVHLVSFADGLFARRAKAFAREAASLGIFDKISVNNFGSMTAEFRRKHGRFIQDNPRGFGYWLWKPHVILDALSLASPDDVIIYSDAGFHINSGLKARDRMLDYIAITSASRFRMLSFMNVHTEYRWTKADLAARLDVSGDPEILGTSQIASGLLFLKPTESNVALIKDWAQISEEDGYRYLDDTSSRIPNHPEFQEHRHDASISSLLRKKRGTSLTFFEVQSYEWAWQASKGVLPMHADRLRV